MFPFVSCSLCFSFHFVHLEFIHIQSWPWYFDILHLDNGTIALPFFATFPLKVLLYSCLSVCILLMSLLLLPNMFLTGMCQ
jgi:hypothetical protein